MRKALAALALLLPLLARAVAPLEVPPPIPFPQFVDSVKVSGALLTALTNCHWIVESDDGHSVMAHRLKRSHRLHARIDYDSHGVSFHYLDSDNFDVQDYEGVTQIHRAVNSWLRELSNEVRLQMQPSLFARDPAEVVPVAPGQ